MTETATLGGGCFWCLEAVFERLQGVASVTSGYAGGHVPDPAYRQVCSGTTGHAEVVRVAYDPAEITFRELLRVFFATHDPTTPNRQGADVGPQYRSIILYESESQRETAEAVITELEAAGTFADPIVTEIEPLEAFYPAEEEHQDFYRNNPSYGYCRAVIDPKVAKLRREFKGKLKRGGAEER
ncbi:MAG: peptide-methionine (S)-S-oxide reductase MsrA [Longimicrobiales bacterium]